MADPSAEALAFLRPLALAVDMSGGPGLIAVAKTAAVHGMAVESLAVSLDALRSALLARGATLPEEVLSGVVGAAVVFQKSQGE